MKHLSTKLTLAALVLAISFSSALAVSPPPSIALGVHQHKRAETRLKAMSEADAQKFTNLLSQTKSVAEKRYLTKALSVGHNMKTVEDFAKVIRGRDRTWFRDNLHLANNSKGKGIQQLWQDSCGPTTALAALGELDPVFSLRYRKANQAEMQKKILERPYATGGKAGVAVNRGKQGGSGRWIEDILNAEKKKTGITFEVRNVNSTFTVDKALSQLDSCLKRGIPVPLVAKSGSGSHYCLVLHFRTVNNQKVYTIHDPWTGETQVRNEGQFRQGRLDLAGNNKLDALSIPMF